MIGGRRIRTTSAPGRTELETDSNSNSNSNSTKGKDSTKDPVRPMPPLSYTKIPKDELLASLRVTKFEAAVRSSDSSKSAAKTSAASNSPAKKAVHVDAMTPSKMNADGTTPTASGLNSAAASPGKHTAADEDEILTELAHAGVGDEVDSSPERTSTEDSRPATAVSEEPEEEAEDAPLTSSASRKIAGDTPADRIYTAEQLRATREAMVEAWTDTDAAAAKKKFSALIDFIKARDSSFKSYIQMIHGGNSESSTNAADEDGKGFLFGSKVLQSSGVGRDGRSSGSGGRASVIPRKKYFATLELHQRVLGVLNKVTPYVEKYREVRNELLRLPINAADNDSLAKIVDTFFLKAVREPHFSELYAKLVGEICKVPKDQITGDPKESTPYKLRVAILHKCQAEFEKPFKLEERDMVGEDGKPLPPEQIEELMQRKKKDQLANIKFVGEMILLRLVSPSVVQRILLSLLFGWQDNYPEGVPPEEMPMYDSDGNELELTRCLLDTTGAYFITTKWGAFIMPEVMNRLAWYAHNFPNTRVRVLMQNLVDSAHQGFVVKKKFKTEEDYEREKFEEELRLNDELHKTRSTPHHTSQSTPGPAQGQSWRATGGRGTPGPAGQSPGPNGGPYSNSYEGMDRPDHTPARRLDMNPQAGATSSPPPASSYSDAAARRSQNTPPPAATGTAGDQEEQRQEQPPARTQTPTPPPEPEPVVLHLEKPNHPVEPCVETVGHLMKELASSKNYIAAVEGLSQFSDVHTALQVWCKRAISTARCEVERKQLPQLLQAVASIEQLGVDTEACREILLHIVDDIIAHKKWEESSPKVWKFWAGLVGAAAAEKLTAHSGLPAQVAGASSTAMVPLSSTGGGGAAAAYNTSVANVSNAALVASFGSDVVVHQGLHNQVLLKLVHAFIGGKLKEKDVALFVTDVLTHNNAVTPVWYSMDAYNSFQRFRPLAVVVGTVKNADKKLALCDAIFSSATLKKTDPEAMVYWTYRDGATPTKASADALFEFLRVHPQSTKSAVMIARVVGATRGVRALTSLDPLESMNRVIQALVDGTDRADRELNLIAELYYSGKFLGATIPASSGFNTLTRLKKAAVVTLETVERATALFSQFDDSHQLVGIESSAMLARSGGNAAAAAGGAASGGSSNNNAPNAAPPAVTNKPTAAAKPKEIAAAPAAPAAPKSWKAVAASKSPPPEPKKSEPKVQAPAAAPAATAGKKGSSTPPPATTATAGKEPAKKNNAPPKLAPDNPWASGRLKTSK